MKTRAVFLMLLPVALIACHDSTEPTSPADAPQFAASGQGPKRFIVVFKEGVVDPIGEATRRVNAHRGRLLFAYEHALKGFAAELSPGDAAALEREAGVAVVEPDQVVSIGTVQSPAPSWGLDRIDQRTLPLNTQYSFGASGTGVHVYIIDTGILLTHIDFGGRAKFGFDAIKDGNGQTDCHGHGTHVAGTAGGATYGVAKAVKLHAVRVLDCGGFGFNSQVIAGINWVTANRIKPAVANMSLGGGFSATLNQAVTNSINAGVSYTIAAGNSNLDACTVSPASTPNAVTVAASDIADKRASFSNVGTCVDLFGPGVSITSDWNTSTTATKVLSGTSMAAPHLAGVAALYLQTHPTAAPSAVSYALRAAATAGVITNPGAGTPNLLGYTGLFGGQPTNLPPIASFDFSCTALTCDFDSNGSQDDLGIVSRSWVFGDGTTGSGLTPHHVYPAGAIRTVTLKVTDGSGAVSSISKPFTLPAAGGRAGALPKPDFTAYPHGPVDFDASPSTDDVGIGSYVWNFGDGKTGTGKTIQHVYSAPNQFYTVTLTVYDVAGQSATKSYQVYPNSF